MKLFILLLLFAGILLLIQGLYNDNIKKIQERVKVEYRFIPRSYYDDMYFSNQFSLITDDIFTKTNDEWFDKNISKK